MMFQQGVSATLNRQHHHLGQVDGSFSRQADRQPIRYR
jgi:hypothetical protein